MSPSAWSDKDEAMYRGIRESNIERGVNKERAEEIAARTVNKHRQAKGRTPNKTTKGTGNPRTPLEDRTKQELYNRAQELDIEGRSGMTKDELVEAIRAAQ